MHGERVRYSIFCLFQDSLSCLVSLFLSFPKFIKQPSMVHFIRNRAMNIFMYILLYELKALHHHLHLILTKIFHSKLMTLKVTPVNLMKPRLIAYLLCQTQSLPVFQAGTNHYNCLLSSMIFLQNITCTSPNLMENPKTSMLRNICKPLNTSLTFLRQSMMMFVRGIFPSLCKGMLNNGSNTCNLSLSIPGKSFLAPF